MKQDIMLVCSQKEYLDDLQAVLIESDMTVTQSEGTQNAMASIIQHNPAFLFLDFDVENAAFFLQKVTSNILLRPIPYILIAGTFLKGSDRAAMFNLGADACIEKPIDPSEVSAVIHAVLRRERKISRLNTGRLRSPIEHKNLTIDPMRRIVTMCGEPVELSPKEFDVLCLLAEHAGVVLAPQTIYEEIWKSGFEFSNTRVADNICSIRQKLKLSKNDTDYIQTIFRVGYRFGREE